MRMRTRVALVTTSWPRSDGDPAGHFVRAEAHELERSGVEVTVVTPPPGGAFGWPGVAARVRERPARALDAARWVAGATLRVRRLKVDRVVCHWALPCAWPIGSASKASEVEVVSHGGDVRLLVALPAPVRARLVRAIARRAATWRFVSEALARSLLASLDPETAALLEAITVVRAAHLDLPGLPELGAAIARRRDELSGVRAAVSVGRLVVGKRVDLAIAHVAESADLDALVVVGDGPERPRLERLAQALGVRTFFVGAVARSDALAWIGAADALIHASAAEGLSTVVREAEALGTRVVRI
jgi:teichuronic acid biosynthesis glycosyltransferase TuaC